MKKIKISMLALAAVAFCACSSDDIALTESAGTPAIGGDGYMSLAINLPTNPSTRANDNFDDGLPSEYAVHDAYLLLFAGDDEATATLYDTYELTTSFDMVGTTTDNITSRSQVVQKIDTPETGDIYALVVLNANNLLSYFDKGATTLSSLQTIAQTFTNGVGSMTSDGFFMCNAPLINAPGATTDPSEGSITTLAYIDPQYIFHTEEQAAENPAAEIYVERGMAKVTMQADASYNSTVEFGDGGTLTVTIDGFALDQTNNVTYLVRNTTGSEDWWGYNNAVGNNYRMAGNAPVATGIYRTYWATDPNYDVLPYTLVDGEKVYDQGMTSIIGTDITYGVTGEEHPQYCLENTFNVTHQNDDETTRAIIKATFDTSGADFYIWDKNHSTLYTYSDIQSLILRALEGTEEIENALHIYADENVDFYSHFTVSLAEATEGTITEASDDATIVITISTPFTDEEFKDPDTGYTPYDVPTVCTQVGLDEVVATLNDVHTIGAYAGGVSYYSVLIKHFGDDLTPWDDSVADASATSENARSYPDGTEYGTTAEQAWLGRYGVLRNNWYDLNITSITEPGSATPPEATGRPDDPTDLYISVDINILSWAKRTQNVGL